MSGSKPWFLVMTPADANQPGSEWKREGTASQGKISVRPIANEGWAALAIFVSIWTMVPLLIWGVGFGLDNLALAPAIIATIVFEVVAIGSFVLLVWAKSTRLNA
ncbi:MAG: hypothetical protein K2P86_12245 [Xanthobacteraceae bacterium]|nr:hypothetical protein [Xanthobacteraceae bacterium]